MKIYTPAIPVKFQNVEKINELEKLYGSIYNVDLFAGGILEVIKFFELYVNL